MGANVYLEGVAAFGFQSGTSAKIIQEIPGRANKRIAIRAFGFNAGGTASNVYFMQSLGKTTLLAAAVTGGSILSLLAEPGPGTNSIAALDYVCVIQDNGVYHFSKIGARTGLSTFVLCTVLTGSCAIGNTLYDLGVETDDDHIVYRLNTTSAVNKEAVDGGIFYGTEKGSPMMAMHLCACTGTETINYITADYINK